MYILFDIGNSKFRVAGTEDLECFSDPVIEETPKDFLSGISLFKELALKIADGRKIDLIAGGIGGPLDENRSVITSAPKNLSQWVGQPFKAEIESGLRAPVYLENDCIAVGLGETIYGSGKGLGIVAYLTISTGIGGAKFINGKPDECAIGFEPGHQIINFDGPPCVSLKCGGAGHLESYISGTAMEKIYGKHPGEIMDESIWENAAKVLAYGLNNTIVHWSPDIVVLGGSMMKKVGISVERVKYHLNNTLKIYKKLPRIEKAALGDIGGIYGSMALIKSLKIDFSPNIVKD